MKKGITVSLFVTLFFCTQLAYAQLPPSTVYQKIDPNSSRQIEAERKFNEGIKTAQQQAQQQNTGISKYIPCMAWKDASDPSREPSGINCNSWQDLIDVIQLFINSALLIATFLATVSFTYAGWLYLTSQGDTGKIKQAHGIFLKVLQGFIFMGIAYLLVKTILSTIAQSGYSLLQ